MFLGDSNFATPLLMTFVHSFMAFFKIFNIFYDAEKNNFF